MPFARSAAPSVAPVDMNGDVIGDDALDALIAAFLGGGGEQDVAVNGGLRPNA
jgi:hypothetical protein